MLFLSIILGSAQTYVGVLITLIALSLFISAENNYIRRIVSNFNTDMVRTMEEYYRIIKDSTKPTNAKDAANRILQDENYWLRHMDNENEKQRLMQNRQNVSIACQNFYIYGQTKLNMYKRFNKQLSYRNEDTYVSLHLLIVSLIIMFLDAVDFGVIIGTIFIYLLIIPSVMFSVKLWYNYYHKPKLMRAQGLQYENPWKKMIIHEFYATLMLLCFLVGLNFFHWYYCLLILILLGIISWSLLRNHWNNMTIERYNYRFAAKHSFYMVLFSVIGTIIVYCSFRFSWLRDFLEPNNAYYLDLWCNNISIICQIEYARYFFVSYLTVFGFFFPILKGYWHNRGVARLCMKKIKVEKIKYVNKTISLQEEYEKIIEDYQQRENNYSEK